jgi:hypothetical protein
MIEIHQGMIYFGTEGRDDGKMTIRRHRLAERLMMDVLNIRGDAGEFKACQFKHLLNEEVDVKVCTMLIANRRLIPPSPYYSFQRCSLRLRSGNGRGYRLVEVRQNRCHFVGLNCAECISHLHSRDSTEICLPLRTDCNRSFCTFRSFDV